MKLPTFINNLLQDNKGDNLDPKSPAHKKSYVGFVYHDGDKWELISVEVIPYSNYESHEQYCSDRDKYTKRGWSFYTPFHAENLSDARRIITDKEKSMFAMLWRKGYQPDGGLGY